MPRIVTVTLNPAIDRVYLANRVKTGDNALIEPIAIRPGGKGINVSRSLARLAVPSTAVAPVAFDQLDNFRAEFRDRCASLVADALVPCPTPMRHTVTLLDHVDHAETHLREPGFPISLDTLAALESTVRALAGPDAIIAICGSLPPGLDAGDVARTVRTWADTGALLGIDASREFLFRCARIESAILKINHHELGILMGRAVNTPTDILRAGRELPHLKALFTTLGPAGCVLVTPDLALHVEPPPTSANPYCTIGCGDAAFAGLLAALAKGSDLPSALASACSAGTSAAFSREPGTINPHSLPPVTTREVRL